MPNPKTAKRPSQSDVMYRKMRIKVRAQEILLQGPSLMTEAEAIAIAKREETRFEGRIKALKLRHTLKR